MESQRLIWLTRKEHSKVSIFVTIYLLFFHKETANSLSVGRLKICLWERERLGHYFFTAFINSLLLQLFQVMILDQTLQTFCWLKKICSYIIIFGQSFFWPSRSIKLIFIQNACNYHIFLIEHIRVLTCLVKNTCKN
jgi:hypothetical protein